MSTLQDIIQEALKQRKMYRVSKHHKARQLRFFAKQRKKESRKLAR